ncbi:MAG TPA: hypothetical protein VFO91_06210 [Anaerolineales bacterium]|nr:hypothetical protein [Anaerolineales bacterium]
MHANTRSPATPAPAGGAGEYAGAVVVGLPRSGVRDLEAFFWLRVYTAAKQSPRPPQRTP